MEFISKIPSDISKYIAPLAGPEFNEVLEIAHRLTKDKMNDIRLCRETAIKLVGFYHYIGSLAGYYEGERVRLQYKTIFDTESGTQKDKEARGKYVSADLRAKEVLFTNMFKSVGEMIQVLKHAGNGLMAELGKSGGQ